MAQVVQQDEWVRLGLKGRTSYEVVSQRTGSQRVTVRYVEIDPPGPLDPPRPMHRHRGVEEVIWIVAGSGLFETPGGQHAVAAGQVVYVPADEAHVTRNQGTGTMRLICFFPHHDIAAQTEEPAE